MRCFSSHVASELLLPFRNAREEEWLSISEKRSEPRRPHKAIHITKKVLTEIGVLTLMATSVVETLAVSLFAGIAWGLYKVKLCRRNMFDHSRRILRSSAFTIGWMACTLKNNITKTNIVTRECFARYFAGAEFSDIHDIKERDRCDRAPWKAVGMERFLQSGKTVREKAKREKEGADFLKEEILPQLSLEAKEALQRGDRNAQACLMTSIFYLYIAGDKKRAKTPSFLLPQTRRMIADLRHLAHPINLSKGLDGFERPERLRELLYNPDAFSRAAIEEEAFEEGLHGDREQEQFYAFKELRERAALEDDSAFFKKSVPAALAAD